MPRRGSAVSVVSWCTGAHLILYWNRLRFNSAHWVWYHKWQATPHPAIWKAAGLFFQLFLSNQYHSPMQDLNLGQCRMAVYENCQANVLTTQPPWLDKLCHLFSYFMYDGLFFWWAHFQYQKSNNNLIFCVLKSLSVSWYSLYYWGKVINVFL